MTKKKIDIDLNLFSVAGQIGASKGGSSSRGTRKSRKTLSLEGEENGGGGASAEGKINYRSRSTRAKTSKNDLLERIRRHQAEQYKTLFDPRHAQRPAGGDGSSSAAPLPLLSDTKELVEKMDAAVGVVGGGDSGGDGDASELQTSLGHLEHLSSIEQEHARKAKIGGIARTLRHYMPDTVFTKEQQDMATKTFFNPLEQWNLAAVPGGNVHDVTETFGTSGLSVDTPPGVFDTEYMVPTPMSLSKPSSVLPKYGCLKGGTLPTYRQHLQTQRQYPTVHSLSSSSSTLSPEAGGHPYPVPVTPSPMEGGGGGGGGGTGGGTGGGGIGDHRMSSSSALGLSERERITGRLQTRDETTVLRKLHEKMEEKERMRKRMESKIPALMEKRRKKILKRTFHVGRKKYLGQVGVLLPNRTLRNNVVTKVQKYRQTPMSDIRKLLLKKGFIKVGSTAPNDVLRKLYESLMLIGGEVENHNSDNLLFNFFQSAPSSSQSNSKSPW